MKFQPNISRTKKIIKKYCLRNNMRRWFHFLIIKKSAIYESEILKNTIARLKNELRETESRAEKWIELTEKTFHFATYARKTFITGTLAQKREILTALGQNFSIKAKKLHITPNEWLIPIEKAYPKLEAEYNRLELQKYLSVEARNAAFAQLILSWGDYWESNPD